jgi:hypothetical protein
MLPTTGFVGGCGIGLSLFVDAIAIVPLPNPPAIASEAKQSIGRKKELDCFVASLLAKTTRQFRAS